MLTVGVDTHKQTNMAVAIDATGREVARWRGPNSVEGWQQLAAWAAARDAEVRWGIEGAWNYGRGLAQRLVEAGATVYEVGLPRLCGQHAARPTDCTTTTSAPHGRQGYYS